MNYFYTSGKRIKDPVNEIKNELFNFLKKCLHYNIFF